METKEIERPALQRPNGPLLPWKTDTELRRQLYRLSEVAEVLLRIERALKTDNPGIYWNSSWSMQVDLAPTDGAHARRIVGKLMRAFKEQPKIEKTSDETMESWWLVNETKVTVKGYLQKTCRYEEIEVDVPATPERVEVKTTPAQPARKEKRRVIVCDDVRAEAQVEKEVVAASVDEVPF